jgi:hypothetical protein
MEPGQQPNAVSLQIDKWLVKQILRPRPQVLALEAVTNRFWLAFQPSVQDHATASLFWVQAARYPEKAPIWSVGEVLLRQAAAIALSREDWNQYVASPGAEQVSLRAKARGDQVQPSSVPESESEARPSDTFVLPVGAID